jgi:hypothetical protein
MARQAKAERYNDLYRQNDLLWKSSIPKEYWKIYDDYLESAALPVMLGTKIPAPPQQFLTAIETKYNLKIQQDLKAWLNRQAGFDRIKVKAHAEHRKHYDGREYKKIADNLR